MLTGVPHRNEVAVEHTWDATSVFPSDAAWSREIESVIAAHPGVLEVAAVAQEDERSGEAVALFVVRKDPNLTEQELVDFCRKELTGYKVPKYVYFRDELPKTNVGKILRRALRDQLPKD